MDKNWIKMTLPGQDGIQGQVCLTLELLSQEMANKLPAGFGRDDPNDNPVLEKPNRPNRYNTIPPLSFVRLSNHPKWGIITIHLIWFDLI